MAICRRDPVDDGIIFWIRAVTYDLAAEILSDTPAGGVLHGYRVDETPFAERCVSPLNKRGHDFPSETLPVRVFLEPKAKLGRNRIRIFQRSHAKAFPVCQRLSRAGVSRAARESYSKSFWNGVVATSVQYAVNGIPVGCGYYPWKRSG
jgi:hypothetical protein